MSDPTPGPLGQAKDAMARQFRSIQIALIVLAEPATPEMYERAREAIFDEMLGNPITARMLQRITG